MKIDNLTLLIKEGNWVSEETGYRLPAGTEPNCFKVTFYTVELTYQKPLV